MVVLLQFPDRRAELARKLPVVIVRTEEDDEQDVVAWLGQADRYGWSAREFHTADDGFSGYLVFHDAEADGAPPLFILIRRDGAWRMFNRRRELQEFGTLDETLECVFPSAQLAKRA